MVKESVDMAFTGRPNVTDAERNRMVVASGPKKLMLEAIKTMLVYNPKPLPAIKKAQPNMVETTLTVKPWDARLKSGVPLSDPAKEASFQKWLKNNGG